MSNQRWTETLWWATADGTAVTNTTTETIIFPDVTIPANYMQDGRLLRVRAFGKYSTVVTANPTLTFALRWGGVAGTLIATSEAIATTTTAQVNSNWSIEALIQTRSNGATGSLLAMGDIQLHTSATLIPGNVFGFSGFDAPAPVTLNLTADAALSLTVDWSAANGSNSLTGLIYFGESLN